MNAKQRIPNVLDLMTDARLATMVRMMMRDDLMHEPLCVAARDRIMKLSGERAELLELCRIALTHCGPPDADYEEWELGYRLRAAIAKAEIDPSPEPVQGA